VLALEKGGESRANATTDREMGMEGGHERPSMARSTTTAWLFAATSVQPVPKPWNKGTNARVQPSRVRGRQFNAASSTTTPSAAPERAPTRR